jgi:hypothetical protein
MLWESNSQPDLAAKISSLNFRRTVPDRTPVMAIGLSIYCVLALPPAPFIYIRRIAGHLWAAVNPYGCSDCKAQFSA